MKRPRTAPRPASDPRRKPEGAGGRSQGSVDVCACPYAPRETLGGNLQRRSNIKYFKDFNAENCPSQGQNVALTGFGVQGFGGRGQGPVRKYRSWAFVRHWRAGWEQREWFQKTFALIMALKPRPEFGLNWLICSKFARQRHRRRRRVTLPPTSNFPLRPEGVEVYGRGFRGLGYGLRVQG